MWAGLGLVLGFVGFVGFVGLEPPSIQRPGDPAVWAFEWVAPPECPSRAEVIDGVRGYLPALAEPPPSPSRADLRVSVSVAAEGSGWAAIVRMSGREGASERRFSAPLCAELADATALITAVALDPVLVAREIASRAEPDSPPQIVAPLDEPPPAKPATPEPIDHTPRIVDDDPGPSPRNVDLGLGVFATGAWGPTTTGYGGVAGSFAVFARRWRWQLEGGWSFPRTLALDDGRRGRVHAWRLGTHGCLVTPVRVIELPTCAGIEAGSVLARGLAPTTNSTDASQPWAAVVIGQGLRWPFSSHLALAIDIALPIALVRGRFVIGEQTFVSLTPIGVRGALGLEARF